MTLFADDLIEMFGLEWVDYVEYLEDEQNLHYVC